MHILITGSAGFIGYFLTRELLKEGHSIYGIDTVKAVREMAGMQPGDVFRTWADRGIREFAARYKIYHSRKI